MRIGDASRARRFADPVRQRWYAKHRAIRFASRMRGAGDMPPGMPTAHLLHQALAAPAMVLAFCAQHAGPRQA